MVERAGLAGIVADVRAGFRTAREITVEAIARIHGADAAVGAVVELLDQRALAAAEAVDAKVAAGADPGPLAGIPFGVKALFDMDGVPTTAGAWMRRDATPAPRDAEIVRRLVAAGAVPVAILNMDEYAYGFVTVNANYGTTHNPHDLTRLAGGSSGGSAAAVASGMLPLTLGSDTNGSIRVPSSLCGVCGFRPAWGSMPMEGVFPFVDCLDVAGPFARSPADIRLVHEVLAQSPLPPEDAASLKIARLVGWFAQDLNADFEDSFAAIAALTGALPSVELPQVAAARSASFLITASRGGMLHLPELQKRAMAFDPETRDRLIAGTLLPAEVVADAEAFGDWFRAQMLDLLNQHDVLIAPATTDVAPHIDDPVMTLGGVRVPARAHLGLLAQPISITGVPVLTVPLKRPGRLPLGIQLIGAPGREGQLFAFAQRLEAAEITGFSVAPARVAA